MERGDHQHAGAAAGRGALPELVGPCKAIQSTFKRLYFDFSDRPLKFYTVAVDKCPGVGLDDYKGKCEPVFMFYRDGQCLETVVGMQAPPLTRLVTDLSAPPAA